MNGTRARIADFAAQWKARLDGGSAAVRLEVGAPDEPPWLHTARADAFVTALGFLPIGQNWELLDADAAPDQPRAAIAALRDAFAADMARPGTPWLGKGDALAMGAQFLACFDAASRQIVTNRMYFGWNPITAAPIEWAFVAFDDEATALLLAIDEG